MDEARAGAQGMARLLELLALERAMGDFAHLPRRTARVIIENAYGHEAMAWFDLRWPEDGP